MADLSGLQRLKLPDLTQDENRTLSVEQGRQILSYLYQLNDQLRYILANLDDENLTETVTQQIRKSYETVQNYGDIYYYGNNGGTGGGTVTVTERKIVYAVMDYALNSIQCVWDDGSLSWFGFTLDENGAIVSIGAQ